MGAKITNRYQNNENNSKNNLFVSLNLLREIISPMFSTAFYYFDGGVIKQKIGVQVRFGIHQSP